MPEGMSRAKYCSRTQTKPCTHSHVPHVKKKTIYKLLALDYHWQPTFHLLLIHWLAAGSVVPKEDSSEEEKNLKTS